MAELLILFSRTIAISIKKVCLLKQGLRITTIWFFTMLKSKYERMSSKTITHRSYQNFTEEQFKEAIRSDCLYIEAGNVTSLLKKNNHEKISN